MPVRSETVGLRSKVLDVLKYIVRQPYSTEPTKLNETLNAKVTPDHAYATSTTAKRTLSETIDEDKRVEYVRTVTKSCWDYRRERDVSTDREGISLEASPRTE